jgi:two-component sensor histidine kinase
MSVTYQATLPHDAEALVAGLDAAVAREAILLREKYDLQEKHALLAQEFEHRLVNGLQLVSSLLHMQSRAATSPEAAEQLTIAGQRVAALGRVHHQLHRLDHDKRVEFKRYLENLCGDLSSLLFEKETDAAILVEGNEVEIPTSFAIPLGFIVNELITNAAKYANGLITVRLETISPAVHSISVSDKGPGLPDGFNPADSKGLGMKIVLSLVQQINGQLTIAPREHGQGGRFTVSFGQRAL